MYSMPHKNDNPSTRAAALRRHPLTLAILLAPSGVAFGAELPAYVAAGPAAGMAAMGADASPGGAFGPEPALGPEPVEYNAAFLNGGKVDVSRFEKGNPVTPGVYPVDLLVNGKGRGRLDVRFLAVSGSDVAAPCFNLTDLRRVGVNDDRVIERLTENGKTAAPRQNECIPFAKAVPGATAYFDTGALELNLTIPQLELRHEPRGYVDPSRWDQGINAGIVQYNFSAYNNTPHQGSTFTGAYLGLQNGVNVEGWRLRQWATLTVGTRAGTHWRSNQLYAQHDVTSLKSQVTLGDSSTDGNVFDTFNVRGVQLASDDRMLADYQRSYAPTVRGVAETNARVLVRQNGMVLTEINVAPGPFEINDLSTAGYGGDLEVVVVEADGRERSFLVPYASIPQLLRPGVARYNLTAGVYRDFSLNTQPAVFQGVYQRGLTNLLTGYAGVQASTGYGAGLVGAAFNTEFGALAFDITGARTQLPKGSSSAGYSARISYGKEVPETRTNITVAAYRYSSSGFYSLRDAIYARNAGPDRFYSLPSTVDGVPSWVTNPYGLSPQASDSWNDYRVRSRLQVNLTQPLASKGSVNFMAGIQDYWSHRRGRDVQYQAGYGNSLGRVSYSLYATRVRTLGLGMDTQVGLTFSVPLDSSAATRSDGFHHLTSTLSRYSSSDYATQATAQGSSRGEHPLYYSVSASRSASGGRGDASGGGTFQYYSPVGTYGGNISFGGRNNQVGVSASGSFAIHAGGITAGPPLGSAFALIEAKGAKGGQVINGQGAKIGGRGYALAPSLTPYRVNQVGIDPKGVSLDVELGNTTQEIVPRAGALVKVKLVTDQGLAVFATIADATGEPMPMGAQVFDASGKAIGIVGQAGLAYMRGVEGNGQLEVRWGDEADQSCSAPYDIPSSKPGNNKTNMASEITRIELRCVRQARPAVKMSSSIKGDKRDADVRPTTRNQT